MTAPLNESTDEPKSNPVLAIFVYESEDNAREEDEKFGKLLEDVKAMHTFKRGMRMYFVVEERAHEMLNMLEGPAPEENND